MLPLVLLRSAEAVAQAAVEVRSIKLGYRQHYRDMLGYIAQKCTGLLLDSRANTRLRLSSAWRDNRTVLEQQLEFLRHTLESAGFDGSLVHSQDDCVEYLLCGECEHRLHKWENSIARLLAGGLFDNLTPAPGKRHTFVSLPDYASVKLYLLSLLWRCHAARAPAFRFVDLGPKHDARLREMILAGDPGEPWEYGCFISTVHLNLDDGKFDRPAIGFMPEAMNFTGEHGLRIVRLVIDGIVLHFVVGSPERMKSWRGSPMFPQLDGRTIVGVDDGMHMPFFRDQLCFVFECENPIWDRCSP